MNVKMSNKNYIIYGGLLFVISILIVLNLHSFINLSKISELNKISKPIVPKSKMTPFDIKLAKELMDKDNDGRCDFCGMNVEFCIDSGMLECTMNPEAKIGILGSDHIHADFKVFINGKEINFNREDYFVRSAFVHVERETNPEETGKVLHMHAKGVPLWLFFKSLGMNFNSSCFVIDNKEFCNENGNKLRFFVNGKENYEYGNYVPKDLDKILISYGSDEEISKQLESITDYAKNH